MYRDHLARVLDQVLFYECEVLMKNVKEAGHKKVLEHLRTNFEKLCQNKHYSGSYHDHSSKNQQWQPKRKHHIPHQKWVKNLSSIPLMKVQEAALTHSHNLTVAPR